MSKAATLSIVVLLLLVAALGWMLWVERAEAPIVSAPTSNEETLDSTDGTGTQEPAPALHERVSVTTPAKNGTVGKTFTITGNAPGNWFFEASAPYMVVTPEGDKIAQGAMQAIGEWMTTELVGFKAEVSISGSYTGPATLVLMKDNPSGLPEYDDSLEVPIIIQ